MPILESPFHSVYKLAIVVLTYNTNLSPPVFLQDHYAHTNTHTFIHIKSHTWCWLYYFKYFCSSLSLWGLNVSPLWTLPGPLQICHLPFWTELILSLWSSMLSCIFWGTENLLRLFWDFIFVGFYFYLIFDLRNQIDYTTVRKVTSRESYWTFPSE